jgi:hypothetical protein
MKTFAVLREKIEKSAGTLGKYKGVPYRVSKIGSTFSLYVDDEKIDVYINEKEAVKAAKEFIDLAK